MPRSASYWRSRDLMLVAVAACRLGGKERLFLQQGSIGSVSIDPHRKSIDTDPIDIPMQLVQSVRILHQLRERNWYLRCSCVGWVRREAS